MKYSVKKKIGKDTHVFVVEGNNLYELVSEAGKFSFPDVHKCGICESDNLTLGSRLAKDKFKYVFVKCLSCQSTVTFGSKQEDPNTYYLRRNAEKQLDWIEYVPAQDNVPF